MVKLTKIYTKGGDKGKTSLGMGQRVEKDSLRIEAIGAVDELNASIGVVCCFSQEPIAHHLVRIQNDLFDVGADLCILEDASAKKTVKITQKHVVWLESCIDMLNKDLAPLSSFVLPGGSQASAFLHQARTVCRRAERRVITLKKVEQVNAELQIFLNRLSDYLFVAARWANAKGQKDVLWQPNLGAGT